MISKRNYGIDLLRLLAMFYVTVLHCLGQGGILSAAASGSALYRSAWFLEVFAYCSVDVFAIISGYVAYSDTPRKTRYASYLRLWLEVVFYGLMIALLFSVFVPGSVTGASIFVDVTPVRHKLYWYFSAYSGLFVIAPLLNHGLRVCSKRMAIGTFLLIFAVFSVYAPDSFVLGDGYSFVWLVLMYILGGVMKKCRIGETLPWYFAAGGILLLSAVQWFFVLFWAWIPAIFRPSFWQKLFPLLYTSPLLVGTAILYVILFSKLKVGSFGAKLLRFAAPGAFSVYVIQCNRYIWNRLSDAFAFMGAWSAPAAIGAVIGIALSVVAVCVVIDRGRRFLFRVCRIDALTEWVERKARAGFDRCVDAVEKRARK